MHVTFISVHPSKIPRERKRMEKAPRYRASTYAAGTLGRSLKGAGTADEGPPHHAAII